MGAFLKTLLHLRYVYIYVLLIPFVNWSFAHVPTVEMPDGGNWAPLSIITGLILVFRDLAQREIGHYIFIPLLIGVAISYEMAGPEIALYSGLAFLISELADWAVYSFSNKPLSARIMLSSTISAPLDSAVFWAGASAVLPGVFTWSTLLSSIASKLLGAYVVSRMVRKKELRQG